jgi:hypothetical protein
MLTAVTKMLDTLAENAGDIVTALWKMLTPYYQISGLAEILRLISD